MLATFDVVSYAGAPLPVWKDHLIFPIIHMLLRMILGHVLPKQELTSSVSTEHRRYVSFILCIRHPLNAAPADRDYYEL